MRSQLLRFLQKRKFRLVTLWKATLKENIDFQLPIHGEFPFTLIFGTFDEIIYLLKKPDSELAPNPHNSFLDQIQTDHPPSADQYMELFLSGREVLLNFITQNPSFLKMFPEKERTKLIQSIEQTIKHLIDREMSAYSKKFQHSL